MDDKEDIIRDNSCAVELLNSIKENEKKISPKQDIVIGKRVKIFKPRSLKIEIGNQGRVEEKCGVQDMEGVEPMDLSIRINNEDSEHETYPPSQNTLEDKILLPICEEPINLSKNQNGNNFGSDMDAGRTLSKFYYVNDYINCESEKEELKRGGENRKQSEQNKPCRKRKVTEEGITSELSLIEDDLTQGSLDLLFNSGNNDSLGNDPENGEYQSKENITIGSLENIFPKIASTPYKTPSKRRRTYTLATTNATPRPRKGIAKKELTRNRSLTTSGTERPTPTKPPRRADSAESLRPERMAKSRATLANERLMTTVIGDTESGSSIEDTTTNSFNGYNAVESKTDEDVEKPEGFLKWRSFRDGPDSTQLFTNKELLKRFKPLKMDHRTKEPFEADLEKIGEILQDKFSSEYHVDFKQRNDRVFVRTSSGRFSHCKADDIPELEKLVMGGSRVLTIRQFVEEGNHTFIKNTYKEFVKDSQLAKKRQKGLRDWFAAKKRGRLVHCKDKYVSVITQLARKGIWKIEKCLNGDLNTVLTLAKMNSPKKKMELEAFQAKLKELAKALTDEDTLRELALTNPSQIYRVIPIPTSSELCDLLIDFVLRDPTKHIQKIGRSNRFILKQARKRGLVITQRSISRREIRGFTAFKSQSTKKDPLTPCVVIQVAELTKLLPKKILDIIDETIFNLILTNTNFEPEEITSENMINIMKDKKGKGVINNIVHYLNRNPTNWLKLIIKNEEIGHFNNSIFRTNANAPSQEKMNHTSDEEKDDDDENSVNNIIRDGIVPKPRLTQNIPGPNHFLNLSKGVNTDNICNFKAQLGRKIHQLQCKRKKQNDPQSTNNGIINPCNSDIHKLMEECNRRNKEEKELVKHLSIVSCNPGQIDTLSLRNLQDHVPDKDIYLVNELGIPSKDLKDSAIIHPGYKLFYNDSCSNGLVYTAILVKKVHVHLITQLKNIGTATTIQINLENYGLLNITSLYRNIERNNDTCFYQTVYDSDCLIFGNWIKELLDLAKEKNAKTIFGGDLNLQLLNPRTEDDIRLVERLCFLFRNHTNVIKFFTFFRNNCNPSSIDYFFMQDPRGIKVSALNLNKEPLNHDGHTGHEIVMKLKGFCKEYEVKINTKHNIDNIKNQSIREAEKLRRNQPENPTEYIEESFRIMSEIIESNQTRTASVVPKINFNHRSQPLDTKRYYEALNFVNSHLYSSKENPEFKFSEKETEILNQFARNMGIMIRKLQRRDNDKLSRKVKDACINPINAAWEITRNLLGEEPVRELNENVEELMDQVVDLQKNTTLDPGKYTKHTFKPKVKLKIKDFKVSMHPRNGWKCSVWSEYKKLKDFTKGSTGISRKILDSFHISAFNTLIARPIFLAITHGLYPECWRTNRTIILAKKKGIRPISISELFAKILEKIIVEQITEFIEHNNLLPAAQNGFRRNLSTGTSLAAVNLFVCSGLDAGDTVGVFTVDMKNAFGTPFHGNLVKCFANLFEGKALAIIGASLERWAIVNKDGAFSRKEKMEEFGVPQGSVCSPMLFCIYISEIINILNSKEEDVQINIFADDTVVTVRSNNFETMKNKAEQVLDKLGEKLIDIGLQLVPEKTSILIFDKNEVNNKKSEELRDVRIGNQQIAESESLKYLGSTLGKCKGILDFEINNENKISKMKVMINRIRSIKNYIGFNAAKTIHRSYCMGVLQHNFEILPKWKSKTHARGQNLYIKGCKAGSETKWYLKKEEFERVKREERIEVLTRSGHPTFFESNIKLFHSQLYKTIHSRKCTPLAEELDKCLWICLIDTGEKICTVGDLFIESRLNLDYEYFKRRHNIELKCDVSRSQCVFNEIIKALFRNDVVEIIIIPDKTIGKIKKEICWPYNLHKDFNSLPRELRNACIDKKHKSIIKNHFKDRHKHPENKYDCEDCVNKREFAIPEYIENPSFNSLNNTIEHDLITEIKKEIDLNLKDSREDIILDAIDEASRARPEFEMSGIYAQWARTDSKNCSFKRCLAKLRVMCDKEYH
ncbi:unnamed protein product [Oikopleura dioica]|uniref:ribonuclease H n=1 Tax=Oikopleura dioica TaxID=34765 RepID=E4WSZ8_OIKDI|nr:unnamed protein product [Oikopleura dioica]